MFGSSPKPASPTPAAPADVSTPARHEPTTPRTGGVLSSGVSIKGNVTFRTELLIDGEVEGNITSTGKLIVGSHACVSGEIRAGHVTIQGTVEGNVYASERCALEAGSSLHGDIESPRFAVDENASFLGSAKIATNRS